MSRDIPESLELEKQMKPLKIGEIARRAGVSVRTLHYYEEIGLLVPTERTKSGHRLYGRTAVERLQQIRSLQQLGLSLSEVDALLRGESVSPQRIVADHLARVREQRGLLDRLEKQLEHLSGLLEQVPDDDARAVEAFLSTMEAMTMYEKYLSPEQLRDARERHDTASANERDAWTKALEGLRAEMAAGTSPDDPKVAALAKAWHDAAAAFMPREDESAHEGVLKALHDEPEALAEHGIEPDLFAYLGRALAGADHEQK